jgi:carboxymethylenebutenolidase
LYGEKDGGIPMASVEQMKVALSSGSASAKAAQFVTYPDTGHAFHADYRPSYSKGPAEDGWARCLAWFKAHGVA